MIIIRELNENKAKNGNEFQNKLYEKYVNNYIGKSYSKNNNIYHINGIGKKISDIEIELISHPKIRIILETTISLRDDRYWAKEVQAKMIKDALKKQKKHCIYILVLPDDTYYEEDSKEPKRNNHFSKIVNNEIAKRNSVGAIDLLVRESDVAELIKNIDKNKYQMPNRIIKELKYKFLNIQQSIKE